MATWSQSHFLPALGWAILNSFWQMALLWCIYLLVHSVFKIPFHRKYQFAVGAIVAGFVWFAFTFVYYFNNSSVSGIAIFNQTINESNSILNSFLLSASITYLSLLIFPSYRLFRNWQFVQRIKKEGLQKADLNYRLFVQKISSQLGIARKVLVYISELVTSPVTIGYLKPIVLLPVAALSNLSAQQVEAILLHELSHIRRHDYLVNFLISIISTFLYFNPFIKLFIKTIEEERENCCDQLVLQFGYDKMSYASALLTLEKLSGTRSLLALGAAGKNYLLTRIEKIVGLEKKRGLKRNQFAGLLAAVLCILAFNSILIIKDKKQTDTLYASVDFANPFSLLNDNGGSQLPVTQPVNHKAHTQVLIASAEKETEKAVPEAKETDIPEQPVLPSQNNMIINVAQDDVEASLTKEQKDKVMTTVAATKKVLANLQWQQVENAIADVLTEKEKLIAKKEYQDELNKTVDWKRVEKNMKAQYQDIDWNKVDNKMNNALALIQLDSLQRTYTIVLNQLNKLTTDAKAEVNVCPLPDQSIEQIEKAKEELSEKVNTIKALRSTKKVVRL